MRRGPSPIAAGVIAVVVVAGVMVIYSGGSDDRPVTTVATSVPTTTVAERPTTTTTTTTTTIPGTAADDLDTFLSRAAELDRALTAAAASIEANMTENEMEVDRTTVDLVLTTRGHVRDLEASVPAGLEPDLLRATLLVFGDLVSRSYAMSGWDSLPSPGYETVPLLETNAVSCLSNGSEAAARYPADLAALRTLARSAPSVEVVAPDSRAAEFVALQLANVEHGNSCCEGCGGFIVSEPVEVTFEEDPSVDPETGARTDGFIDGVPFQAEFEVGLGWSFEIFAG